MYPCPQSMLLGQEARFPRLPLRRRRSNSQLDRSWWEKDSRDGQGFSETPSGWRKDSKNELKPHTPEPGTAFPSPHVTPLSVLWHASEDRPTRRPAAGKSGGRREHSHGLKPVVFAFVSPTEVTRGIQGHPAPRHQSLLPAVSDPTHPVWK